MALVKTPGSAIGKITFQSVCHCEQPSILAASSIESGMRLKCATIIQTAAGSVIEDRAADAVLPIPYIPSYVLINDGLTGDTSGESEVEQLEQLAREAAA